MNTARPPKHAGATTQTIRSDHWNDVERQLTVSQQMRLALGHKLVDGESLVLAYWLDERVGYGDGADYATAYQVLDPDRLANPYLLVDNEYLRGGVEIDGRGVPLAYHLRQRRTLRRLVQCRRRA